MAVVEAHRIYLHTHETVREVKVAGASQFFFPVAPPTAPDPAISDAIGRVPENAYGEEESAK